VSNRLHLPQVYGNALKLGTKQENKTNINNTLLSKRRFYRVGAKRGPAERGQLNKTADNFGRNIT